MFTKYFWLKTRLVLHFVKEGKITPKKLWNALRCYIAYFFKSDKSAPVPILINFELSNYCNERCVFCRTKDGKIYDQNPVKKDSGSFVEVGMMDIEMYKDILTQTKDRLLMAIPYVNGEPFIYPELGKVIKFATDNNVATMIATNGTLMNEENIDTILASGLDFIKVHISGFTQAIHNIEHRVGDVEVIKNNLRTLSKKIKERKSSLLVLLDYIHYNHNAHELEPARQFAKELGIMFNVRPGNPYGMEDKEEKQHKQPLPIDIPCDWLWKVLTINWNGDVFPCCEYVTWTDIYGYGKFATGKTSILAAWNGPLAINMRRIHRDKGRAPIPICAQCPRKGVEFKF